MRHETRQATRRHLPGTAVLDDGDGPVALPVLDVSHSGLFLRSDLLPEEGERFAVRFALPQGGGEIVGEGEVVRVQGVLRDPRTGRLHCPGFGLRFICLTGDSARQLQGFLQ